MPAESSRHSDSANYLTGHRGQVMQEMKVNSLAELVRMVVKLQSERQAIY
jgi:FixJ family two-component response regulator